MASEAQQKAFIKQIAPLIQKYAREYGYKVASPIIAQACVESAYGLSSPLSTKYHNYFGLKCGSSWKGKSVNLKTREEYTVGKLTTIKDNFRVYNSMEEGVKGYFTFIGTKRYANLKTATTPEQYLERIKADGYATSSTYVSTNMRCVVKHNLTQYDDLTSAGTPEKSTESAETAKGVKSYVEVAKEVIQGKWGNGTSRKKKLTEAGYDYAKVQAEVNRMLKG